MLTNYALITGSSSGLGLALSEELASRGYNLLLVSLANENLKESANTIRKKSNVSVEYFETNLTQKENIVAMCNWANEFPISVLINNAGCGGSKKITEASIEYIHTIIELNIVSTALITKLILPNLVTQKESYILNVSSMAAFSPIGYKTVYPASKKFIEHFSLGLAEELKDKNTSVTVLYPGPMKTNKEVSSRIEKQSAFVRSGVVDTKDMAYNGIKSMFLRKKRVIPGKLNKLSKWILFFLPLNMKIRILSTAVKKEINV